MSNKITIYVVRHGKTIMNTLDKVQLVRFTVDKGGH